MELIKLNGWLEQFAVDLNWMEWAGVEGERIVRKDDGYGFIYIRMQAPLGIGDYDTKVECVIVVVAVCYGCVVKTQKHVGNQ